MLNFKKYHLLLPHLLLCGVAVFAMSCAGTPPLREASIASVAYKDAKKLDAHRHASKAWFAGEDAYNKARYYYGEKQYKRARALFMAATKNFEKAQEQAYQKGLD